MSTVDIGSSLTFYGAAFGASTFLTSGFLTSTGFFTSATLGFAASTGFFYSKCASALSSLIILLTVDGIGSSFSWVPVIFFSTLSFIAYFFSMVASLAGTTAAGFVTGFYSTLAAVYTGLA